MSSQLTKQEANNIKQTLDEMSRKNAEAINKTIEAFKKGEITLEDYRKKIDEINRSQAQVDKTTQELIPTTETTSAKSVIAWTAVATAVIAVVKATKDAILQSANYADQIGDVAEKWGFTTKEIQEFDYWATMSGTTLESLLTGMRGLVNQAEAGAPAFEKLGVSVKNADGTFKDQKTLFLETIDALNQVEDRTQRNALQFEIFGRAGIELGQVISRDASELQALSSEAENLGIILSEDIISQAGNLNDQLDQIKLSFKSVLAELVAGSPEAEEKLDAFLDNLGERVADWLPKFVKIGGTLLSKVIESLITMLPDILPAFIESIMGFTLEFDWVKLGKSIISAVLKGALSLLVNNPLMQILSKIFGFSLDTLNQGIKDIDLFGDKAKSSLNNLSSYTSSSTTNAIDNSNYAFEVNISSSNYTEQDARVIADEVIKQIATKKQARG